MGNIILYGAFDRHNYGDLLFPIIMQRLFLKEFPEKKVVIAGLINTDLSIFGALPTVSIKDALKNTNKHSALILAGGDIIACDWLSAYGYLLSPKFYSFFVRYICRFLPKATERVIQKIVGLDLMMPFSPGKDELGRELKIIYNSVGATGLSNIENALKAKLSGSLKQADYITVRDHFSDEQLGQLRIVSSGVYPDSATVMSTVFSTDELNSNSNGNTLKLINKFNKNYIVFQISSSHCNGMEQDFAASLTVIAKKYDCPILLLAIGNASGHGDSDGVNQIKSHLPVDIKVCEYLDGCVFDIMNIIKHAKCYCGTSLHGLITSISFNVPRVGLLPKLRKQRNYMDTWDLDSMPRGVMPNDLVEAVEIAINISREKLASVGDNSTDKYLESFNKICSLIK